MTFLFKLPAAYTWTNPSQGRPRIVLYRNDMQPANAQRLCEYFLEDRPSPSRFSSSTTDWGFGVTVTVDQTMKNAIKVTTYSDDARIGGGIYFFITIRQQITSSQLTQNVVIPSPQIVHNCGLYGGFFMKSSDIQNFNQLDGDDFVKLQFSGGMVQSGKTFGARAASLAACFHAAGYEAVPGSYFCLSLAKNLAQLTLAGLLMEELLYFLECAMVLKRDFEAEIKLRDVNIQSIEVFAVNIKKRHLENLNEGCKFLSFWLCSAFTAANPGLAPTTFLDTCFNP